MDRRKFLAGALALTGVPAMGAAMRKESPGAGVDVRKLKVTRAPCTTWVGDDSGWFLFCEADVATGTTTLMLPADACEAVGVMNGGLHPLIVRDVSGRRLGKVDGSEYEVLDRRKG